MARTIAAFDFDGTLTRRDTMVPFLASVAGTRSTAAALVSELPTFARGDRDRAKERVLTRLLAGRRHADLVDAGNAYGAGLVRRAVTPEMRRRVAWHRGAGHDVVIVSASLDVYLDEVARLLGADDLVCTSLEVDEHGCCTGVMVDGNCRGAAKASRVRALLAPGDEVAWAYGDSRSDDEFLALATYPVRVRRGRLRGEATTP